MFRQFLTKILVRNAMAFEAAKKAFYLKAAETVKDERARALLRRAAAEEDSHLERLRALQEQAAEEVVKTHHAEELKKLGLEPLPDGLRMGPDSTAREVLEAAIEQEKAAYDFYYLLAERAKLRTLKETFALIAREEHEHLEAMRRELSQTLAESSEVKGSGGS